MTLYGILGGLTPEATVYFQQRLIESKLVDRDQEHIRTLVCNDPSIPDRHEAILGGGESPEAALVERAKVLDNAGADVILIPEPIVYNWYDVIAVSVDARVPRLGSLVMDELDRRGWSAVCVLCTEATKETGIYDGVIDHVTYAGSSELTSAVYTYKIGERQRAVEQYVEGAEQVPEGVEGTVVLSAPLSALEWPLSQPTVDGVDVLVNWVAEREQPDT